MIHIYLCAAWQRQAEMRGHAEELRDAGYQITSRWIDVESAAPDGHVDFGSAAALRAARLDLEDVEDAHILIAFTEPAGSPWTRGGRHAEVGAALAWGLELILVGPHEHLFHALAKAHYETWDRCLLALRAGAA